MNIEEMSGWELRLLVAKHVMGWKILTDDEMAEEAKSVWEEQPSVEKFLKGFRAWRDPDGTMHVQQELRPWDSSPVACGELVDRLLNCDFTVRTNQQLGKSNVVVESANPFAKPWICAMAQAETVELATCRAAAKAMTQNGAQLQGSGT